MSGRKVAAEREAPGRIGHRLRWTRVGTLALVLLIHLGFLVFLLAPPPGWRWPAASPPAAPPDALVVRLLPPRNTPAEVPPAAVRRPPAPAAHPARLPEAVAKPTQATAQAAPAPAAAPRSIDSLIATTPPSYVAGGGRLSAPDYGQQNVRVPGSSRPVRGTPLFRMADPRMQGIAGVVRFVGSHLGAIDPHCLELDAESGMSRRERIAHHVDDDGARRAAMAERYGCPDPLKPGAAMYYFTH